LNFSCNVLFYWLKCWMHFVSIDLWRNTQMSQNIQCINKSWKENWSFILWYPCFDITKWYGIDLFVLFMDEVSIRGKYDGNFAPCATRNDAVSCRFLTNFSPGKIIIIDYLLFQTPLKNFSLIWSPQHNHPTISPSHHPPPRGGGF
jgi:hypothetical protein